MKMNWRRCKDRIVFFATLVLACATVWLAYETWGLRKETAESVEAAERSVKTTERILFLDNRPALTIEAIPNPGGHAGLLLKNTGKGPSILDSLCLYFEEAKDKPLTEASKFRYDLHGANLAVGAEWPISGIIQQGASEKGTSIEGFKLLRGYVGYRDLWGYQHAQFFKYQPGDKTVWPDVCKEGCPTAP